MPVRAQPVSHRSKRAIRPQIFKMWRAFQSRLARLARRASGEVRGLPGGIPSGADLRVQMDVDLVSVDPHVLVARGGGQLLERWDSPLPASRASTSDA